MYRLHEQNISNFSDLLHPKRMTCFESIYLDFTLIMCLFPLETALGRRRCPTRLLWLQTGYRQVITRTGWRAKGLTVMKL